MSVMPAAVLRGIHDLVVDERPVPSPGPDEVLVLVTAVGVCGSDVHHHEHGRIGRYVVERPLVLAHEPAGARGRVDLDSLVTGHVGLSSVEAALTAGAADPRSVEPVVHPVR
jgi:Zn-dependent alcohol dehydrogenase